MKSGYWLTALLLVPSMGSTAACGQGRISSVPSPSASARSSSHLSNVHHHWHQQPPLTRFWGTSGFPASVGSPYSFWPPAAPTVFHHSSAVYLLPAPVIVISRSYYSSVAGEPVASLDVPLPPPRRPETLPPPRPLGEPPKAKEAQGPPPPKPEPPPLPGPAGPARDPKTEHARETKLGSDAFAVGEYGRAERRFREAIEVLPEEPYTHFLLAQARFAQGKFQEAVVAIHTGMRLNKDWARAKFHSREVYGGNEADFVRHLTQLSEALAKYPGDPILLFLFAHQLWFDDRREEARPLFERASLVAPETSYSEWFLQVN